MTVALISLISTTAIQAAPVRTEQGQVLTPARQHVVKLLERGLAGTPMAGTARRLEQIAYRWHVSPFFIIGASGRESSLGTRPCSGNPRNIWGLNNCSEGAYIDLDGDGRKESLPVLRSWGHAYTWFARYVRARYPSARTPWDFNGYCRCSGWGDSAATWMRRLFDVAPTVTYA